MNTTGWSHTLLLIGISASLLIAIVYVRTRTSVRKQGRTMGWGVTGATLLAIAAILFVSLHGNLFGFLFPPTGSSFWPFSTGTTRTAAPVSLAVTAAPVHRHTEASVVRQVAAQTQQGAARQKHSTTYPSTSIAQPAPFLVMLEGLASIIGIILVLCFLMTGGSLIVRSMHHRQEAVFLDTSPCDAGCATCGQEGEFPQYRDSKGQVAPLYTDCVGRFQVTPVG